MSAAIALSKTLYVATATATGGREGHVATDDGAFAADLSIPEGLGGSGAAGTNPEQLFAAGYAACFGSALALVAKRKRIDVGEVAITAHVAIGPVGSGFGLGVELEASLPNVDREQGEALLAAAHEVCPYSNATRGNIEVKLRLA